MIKLSDTTTKLPSLRSLLAPKKPKDKEKSRALDDWLNQRESQLINTIDDYHKKGEPPDKKLKTSESGGPPVTATTAATATGTSAGVSESAPAQAAAASQRLGMGYFCLAGNFN